MLMILARVRKQLLLYPWPCVEQRNRKIEEELPLQVRVPVSPLLQPVALAIVYVEIYSTSNFRALDLQYASCCHKLYSSSSAVSRGLL